ncbi:eosinophil peroxidase-like [Salvelinus namaycush]|uniref:Eosinophil peroxidase-like n=1 Tax=Salvelinus namaycush TaxID=8040 RepID=A0A8U0TN27_SALNM|nr:eosinophil peroxidase-like [Salvelinus namaycush]
MKPFPSLLALGLCLMFSQPALSTEESLGGPFIHSSVEEAKRLVDEAYKYSREKSLERVRGQSTRPSDVLRLLKQPARDTRSAVRSADYLENTLRLIHEKVHSTHRLHKRSLNATDLLTPEQLDTIVRVTGCAARVSKPSCHTTPNMNKYRTATSVCNNLKFPRLGASNTPFTRFLPAQYDDGVSRPIGWDRNTSFNNFVLPLVREVSNRILATNDSGIVNDSEFTHFVTLFGQWNDHDLTFTPFSPSIRSFSNGLDCNEKCERSEPCFPIQIPPRDPRLPTGPDSCIPVFRSAPACGTGESAFNFGGVATKREQINSLTAFLDLGQVYGSEEGLARDLRDLTNNGGLLRVNKNFTDKGREFLPFTKLKGNMCATRNRVTNDTNAREVPCFIAGDARVDENIALTSIHTMFMREHNRLARALSRLNPQWDAETLYQEARKIMGAYTQLFVFRDYLPHIVGPDTMARQLGRYPGYNEKIDPSIANVFATAAYRFAHLAIQPILSRLDSNYMENAMFPNVPLFKAFFTPWRLVFEGGIDPLIRGLVGRPAKLNTQDHMLVDAVRERLFQFVEHLALDLGSLNMQRGRDHGLPGYNAWRKFCGLSTPRNEAELGAVLNNIDLARRLLQLYGTPANIDVWMGGVAEPFVRRARVGPLFACLIATQFQRIRQGDRLWYENPGVFTSAQRASLSRASLGRIICDNTGILTVPRDPFRIPDNGNNRLITCNTVPQLSLQAWRERPTKAKQQNQDHNQQEDQNQEQQQQDQDNEIP